ncbi:MAG: co-chaperone GroES [Chloroflexota bacterium]
MAEKIQPLGDRVVVKPRTREEKTKTGIFLPDTAQDKPSEGTVVAVGTGRLLENGERVPMEVKVGDTVLYAKYAGTEIKLDGEEFVILREADVLAVVKEE